MSTLFKKLNLKDQARDRGPRRSRELRHASRIARRRARPAQASGRGDQWRSRIVFATTLAAVEKVARDVAPRLDGDAILWFAYPKGTSKRYTCEFNRDTGWASLGTAGFEPVRQVAIDEDWSALRFRRVEYISTLRRDPSRALSERGKARASAPRDHRAA